MQPTTALPEAAYRGATYDKRTRKWRAVRDAFASIAAQIGKGRSLTENQRQRIERAAELQVLASEARRAALSDPSADKLNTAVRIENAAERALKATSALFMSPPSPGLAAYMAERGAP